MRGNSTTAEIPVVMSTANGTEYDKVLGLDAGADDYLVKTFCHNGNVHIGILRTKLGGKIDPKSTPGKGTTAMVRFTE